MEIKTTTYNIKKSSLFTDIHWGAQRNSELHNSDCMRFIEWFCDQTINNNCDSIIFLGDWFENRNSINILTFNNSLNALRKLNLLNIPIFFIVGNHDLYYRNNRDIHSLDFLNEFSNVVIIDTPIILDDNKLLCPFLFKDEYPEITPIVNKSKYVFGHWEFRNFYLTRK